MHYSGTEAEPRLYVGCNSPHARDGQSEPPFCEAPAGAIRQSYPTLKWTRISSPLSTGRPSFVAGKKRQFPGVPSGNWFRGRFCVGLTSARSTVPSGRIANRARATSGLGTTALAEPVRRYAWKASLVSLTMIPDKRIVTAGCQEGAIHL